MTSALRLIVAAVIIVLLARAAKAAWHNRDLALSVWRRIRPRHVAGSVALLAVVMAVAVGLMTVVPVTGIGLGTLIGLAGNAVFAPVEEAAARSTAVAGAGAETAAAVLNMTSLLFLAGLLALFPWLAYVEERVFREGLEDAGAARRLWTALRFGLVHLVMLVPVAAALAIAVAGLWYGHIYRRAYRRLAPAPVEQLAAVGLPAAGHDGPTGFAAAVHAENRAHAREQAVLESTVWHTTFNSTVVVLLIAGFAAGWL